MLTDKKRSLTGETVMTLYIGVDFHPHQQTAAWCDTGTGETAARKKETESGGQNRHLQKASGQTRDNAS